MFPRSFLFFIFIIIIDIILKSLKDKKKIEEARRKRSRELNKDEKDIKRTVEPSRKSRKTVVIKPVSRESVEERSELERIKTFTETKSLQEEPTFPELTQLEIGSMTEKELQKNRTRGSNEQLKKDVLKGIIYSEILSEPKSLRNRKSI